MSVYIHSKPSVSDIFCDNIVITFEPGKQHYNSIINNVQELCCASYGSDTNKNGPWCKISKGDYRYAAYLTLADDIGEIKGRLEIRCDPNYEANRFLRLKWNPSYLSCSSARYFIDQFLEECGGYQSLMAEGKLTELHLTTDVVNADLNRCTIYYPGMRYSAPHLNNGKWESYQLGKKESNLHFMIYDKVKQSKVWNNKHHYFKVGVPECPTMRIEAVLRDIQASALAEIKNPFEKLCISQLPKALEGNEPWLPMFVRTAQIDGAQDALLLVPTNDRKRFKKILAHHSCGWWQPDHHWMQKWSAMQHSIINPIGCL